jgi:hypothetical protein
VRVGVISDTHLPRFGRALPRALVEGLRGADVSLILHLGDHTTLLAEELCGAIGPYDAVAGNNDGPELVARYGRRKLITVGGARIGMIHGDGERGTTLGRSMAAFADDEVDVVLFGHSHIPYLQRHGARWVLNPGSPTDKRRQPRYSYAILEIAGGEVTPRLVYYDDRTV